MWRAETLLILEHNLLYRGLNDNDDDTCSICFESDTDDNQPITLLCGHKFHLKCILKWLAHQKTCPLCRQVIEGHKNFPEQLNRSLPEPLNYWGWDFEEWNIYPYREIYSNEKLKELMDDVEPVDDLTPDKIQILGSLAKNAETIMMWNDWRMWRTKNSVPKNRLLGGASNQIPEYKYWESLVRQLGLTKGGFLRIPPRMVAMLKPLEHPKLTADLTLKQLRRLFEENTYKRITDFKYIKQTCDKISAILEEWKIDVPYELGLEEDPVHLSAVQSGLPRLE